MTAFRFSISRVYFGDSLLFIGVPENTSALMTLEQNEKLELDLKISFNKVYPKPTCKIKLGVIIF